MNRVMVHQVTRANWRDALRLTVRPDQQRFVADHVPIGALILSKAYVRALDMDWEPCVFVAEGELVGMAALAAEPARADLAGSFTFSLMSASRGAVTGVRRWPR